MPKSAAPPAVTDPTLFPKPSSNRLRLSPLLGGITESAWQSLTGTDNPFLSYRFLKALEQSGCVSPEQGWLPQHLLLEDGEGQLLAALPLYLKNHSYGEYIFDWGWAEAYQRYGLNYYPKLSLAIPFSPVSTPRILLAPNSGAREQDELLAGLLALIQRQAVSSCHVLYHPPAESAHWQAAGFLARSSLGYVWQRGERRCFEQYLSDFSAERRKKIKRERRGVQDSGVQIARLTGAAISEGDWRAMHAFYRDTYQRRSGFEGYFNEAFFQQIGQELGDQILMVKAEAHGETIAAALFLFDKDTLYGRHWGSRAAISGLHFELCYYQGIEFCLERSLARFEPGTQGQYKLARGFEPLLTHSSHWLADNALKAPIAAFLKQESEQLQAEAARLREHLPFKRSAREGLA